MTEHENDLAEKARARIGKDQWLENLLNSTWGSIEADIMDSGTREHRRAIRITYLEAFVAGETLDMCEAAACKQIAELKEAAADG